MKRIYLLLVLPLLFLTTTKAQAVYPSTSYAVAGDTFYVSNAKLDSLFQFNFQTAGANITWNYSKLEVNSQNVDRFLDPNTTGYKNSFINECVAAGETRAKCELAWAALTNIAQKQQDSLTLSTVAFTDVMGLEEKTTGSLVDNILGLTLQSNGPAVPLTVKYTKPDTIYHFPLQYGHEDSCNSYYTFNLKNLGINLVYRAHTKRVNNVEGYGNVTTPYKNYPTVLKLKTTLTYSDTIIYNGKVIPLTVPKGIQYRWFDPNVARAVLYVNGYYTAGGQQVYTGIEFLDAVICLAPVVRFTVRPDNSTLNAKTQKDTVDFINNSENANSYTWNFGDPNSGKSNTSTIGSTYHVYSTVGTYTVTLTACNTICVPPVCDTLTKTLTVVDSGTIKANFSYNPLEPCLGTAINFTNLSTNATTYLWLFGDGKSANTKNAQHTYTTAGTDTVTLYAFSGNTVDSIRRIVVINTQPEAKITANGPIIFCEGDSVVLTSSAGDVYHWSTGSLKQSITVKKSGIYSVTVSNSCGSSSTSISITVNPVFVPSLTLNPSANGVCPGTIVTFTAVPTNGGANPTYQWKVNGTDISNTGAVYTDNSVNNGDVVSAVMTATGTCIVPDTASASVTLVVGNGIRPSVSIVSNPAAPYCQGTNVVFSAIAVGGGTSPVFQWKLNNGLVSSSDSFTSNSLTNGNTLSVTLTSNDACASPTTADTSVTISILPVATSNVSASICAGQNYDGHTATDIYVDTFAAANGCDSIRTLSLTVIPVVQNTVTLTICNTQSYAGYTSTGTYIDTFLSAQGCDSIRTLNLTVNPNDTAAVTITPSSNGICPGTPVSFTATAAFGGNSPTYIWTLNGNVVGTNSPHYAGSSNFSNGDKVAVTLISNQACAIPDTAFDTVVMVVNANIVPSVTISSNIAPPYCQGNPVTFYANILGGGNPPTAVIWKLNNSQVNTADSFSSGNLHNGDVITVQVFSSAGCANPTSATDTDKIVVLPVSQDTVTTAICPGSSYYNYSTPGTFIDTFAAANGCDSIRTLNLSFFAPISDTITTTICEGDTVAGYDLSGTYIDVFTAADGCDSTRTLVLTVNPVGLTNTNVAICQGKSYLGHDISGVYIDTIVGGSADNCDSIVFIELTVNPLPAIPAITVINDTAYATDSSTNIASYQWYNSTGLIQGATGNSYAFTTPGDFSVLVTDSNGCTNLNKGSILGINKINSLAGISIYPNPTDGKFLISLPQMQVEAYQVQVWNMLGELVVPVVITSNPIVEIDLSSFSQGLYLIKVKQGDQQWSGKVNKN